MLKKYLYLLLISVMLAISLYQSNFDKISNKHSKNNQEYMRNLTIINYNETGKIKDQISASYWSYIPYNNVSTVYYPRCVSIKTDGTKWEIKSDKGVAYHKESNNKVAKLELMQNVLVLHDNDISIATEKASYYPDIKLIETDKFVTMHRPGFTVSSVGFRGNLQQDFITLLDKVKTNFVNSGNF